MTRRDQHLIDPVTLGRRVRAARALAGFDKISEVADELRELGLPISDRTLYAVERGEQLPALDLLVGLSLVLEPPGGPRFWWAAIAPEHLEKIVDMSNEDEATAIKRAAGRALLDAKGDLMTRRTSRRRRSGT